jgi:hypothetical protein
MRYFYVAARVCAKRSPHSATNAEWPGLRETWCGWNSPMIFVRLSVSGAWSLRGAGGLLGSKAAGTT